MTSSSPPTVCFVVVVPDPSRYFEVLSTAFTHPWVISYQVGFGPPLVRAHDRLMDAVRQAKSALEKLEAYLRHCYVDDAQRRRLAQLHRRLLVRRFGPVEAEALRTASRDVLDLTVQLYPPHAAPEAVGSAMRAAGAAKGLDPDDPPQLRTGRFWIHLPDLRNERLLCVDAVRARVQAPDEQAALALTVPAKGASLFAGWFAEWAEPAGWAVVRLDGPVSVARAQRDGVRL